jgi:hypothetical protein
LLRSAHFGETALFMTSVIEDSRRPLSSVSGVHNNIGASSDRRRESLPV